MRFLPWLSGPQTTRPRDVDPADAPPAFHPPLDPGIACASVDALLAGQGALLDRLKLCYGADRSMFDENLLSVVRSYAAYVNTLPATADNYFCEPGGLFRLGLEIAFFSLQGTDGHLVSARATITERRTLEPRWRHATFLAGLCSELHRTLSHLVVLDARGNAWPPYLMPLTPWLGQQRADRFRVRWVPHAQESRGLGLFALPQIVPPATLQYLASGNTTVVPQLLAGVSGVAPLREHNVMFDLIRRAAALVIDRDLVASANRHGRPIVGAHLERYLLEAMRRLVATEPSWLPNTERSRVWHARDGLFLIWPSAAAEIRKTLEEDELPGLPKAPEAMLEILLAAGVFEARSDGGSLWTIVPPGARTVLEAVKLRSPTLLLDAQAQDPPPLPVTIAVERAAGQPVPGPAPTTTHATRTSPQAAPARRPGPAVRQATPRPPQAAPQPPVGQRTLVDPEQVALPFEQHAGSAPPIAAVLAAQFESSPSEAGDEEALPPADWDAGTVRIGLKAPMRLMPQVRDALAATIETMNGEARSAAAITLPSGVFVPIAEFERHGVDASVALRALAESGMVAGAIAGRARTVVHDLGGSDQIGVVLHPRFVSGVNPADFAQPG